MVKLQQRDFDDVLPLYTDHEVRRYLGGTIAEEHLLVKFSEAVKRSNEGSSWWVARLKNTNDFIGLVSLDKHVDGDTEVSYEFLPTWWGAGFATEVIGEVLTYTFDVLELPKVIADTQSANARSRRLFERLGMKLERTVQRHGAEQAIYSIEKQ